MSGKRNISYVKPQDPSFLAKLKAQIGYKEGPTVETKRQRLDFDDNSSGSEGCPDREEEKPQIVVLQSGDLTPEEVRKEEARIAREAAEARADLSRPIIFQKRKDNQNHSTTSASSSSTSEISSTKSSKSSNDPEGSKKINKRELKQSQKKKKPQTSKLSFDADEEEDEN
ncbi:uncharacterized protein KIAA1143 homolog [Rhagoletis pomonella]|uniref:uncharacterized protein KIAA1143 homolog n=1 Tax=Rhagoletis pomonella TaxID=28610 RepID=UPI0017814988|nr:uncharacterized protein KIAA1143 homolog [Rhagoletis pomonella]XP_036335984.1 uncharacterized protein KIAA1143 homolog [Rhagoletis pomonella]